MPRAAAAVPSRSTDSRASGWSDVTPISMRVDGWDVRRRRVLLADHRRARAAASPADPAATPWEPSLSRPAAAASRSASVDASMNRLSGSASRRRFPRERASGRGASAAVAPGTSLSSRLSVTGVIGSMAAGVRSRGTPSTSTHRRPRSGPRPERPGRAPRPLREPRAHASRAPRSWPATEPRIVESIFTYSRSQPWAIRSARRGSLAAAVSSRAARTPVTTASSEGPSSIVRPRGGAAQHVRRPALFSELRSRIGGAGQVVGHHAQQPWSHEVLPERTG